MVVVVVAGRVVTTAVVLVATDVDGATVVGARRRIVPAGGERDAARDGDEGSPQTHAQTLAQAGPQSGSSGTMKPGSWPS